MNSFFNLSPLRLGSIGVFVGLGAALTYGFKAIWPFIYPSTQWAFLAMGLAFASLVALSGACGWMKRVLIAVTVLMTLAWTYAGLLEIIRLASYVLGAFVDGRRAGATPVASLQGALAVIRNITPVQSKAFLTCIFVGLPPLVILILTIVLTLKRTSENRVSENGPWKARWMSEAQIGYLRSAHTGLPLGLNEGALLRYAPNSQKGWRAGHHVVIAGTRAGKGVSVVIPAIVDHHGPVVALDVKGENFAVTRRWRRSLGRRVVVLNPFGIIEESRDGYNPLDYIRPEHLVRDIDVIAEGLVLLISTEN